MRQVALFRWGGKRKGAGRKPVGERAGGSHEARPQIRASMAMHVTIRVAADIRTLRDPSMYAAIRGASAVTAEHKAQFRINQLSIQRTHLHLIVEAESKLELARGMQSFLISAARRINAARSRRGVVFTDRYHLVVIRSPKQMRAVLAYVFGNSGSMARRASCRRAGSSILTRPAGRSMAGGRPEWHSGRPLPIYGMRWS